jgi:hypothetical protein
MPLAKIPVLLAISGKEEVSLPRPNTGPSTWEKVAGFIFGVVFVATLLVLAIKVPNPTEPQFFVFRIVLALAAAGVAAIIPGFLNIESKTVLYVIRAGGALGVFLLVYLVNPPGIFRNEHKVAVRGDVSESATILSGTVVERDTNRAIGQATIVIVGRAEQTITDDNGSFRIDLPANAPLQLRLRVSKTGYQTLDTIVAPAENLMLPLHK